MMFTGHHCGEFTRPSYFPPLPDTSMTLLDMPIGCKNKGTGTTTTTDENGNYEKTCTIEVLTSRIDVLERRLIQSDLLVPFAARMTRKLAELGQLSEAELKSAAQFGIKISSVEKPLKIKRPVAMLDNHTGMDEYFLRRIGEIKEKKDFSQQFPEILEGEDNKDCAHESASMAILHRFGTDLKGIQSDESLFDVDTDEGYLENYARSMRSFDAANRRANEEMQGALNMVQEIKSLAIQLAQAAAETRESRESLGARLDDENSDTE